MVNWKSIENQQRLVATLLAANPGLKLDYPKMAAIFSQGATYDTIESQFRKYRKQADELKKEAARQGISLSDIPRGRASAPVSTATTPRTPWSNGRGGVIKAPSSTGKGKGKGSGLKGTSTPTKPGPKKDTSGSFIEAIYVNDDDEDDEDCCGEEDFSGVRVKSEGASGSVIPSIEPPVFGLASRIKTESEDQDFKLLSDNYSRATSRAARGKSRVLQKDVDGDEEMAAAPAFNRTTRENAPTPSLSISRGGEGYETDSTDGVA
ncbi:hypothetical protein BJX62DRAFT_242984 [Aspergillus germanicus]